ncbi:multidrug ABC transporter ATP-binding protein [Bifidobacterium callitrichos]|nr:multidrug ABC transporter ATP-binding protein [Bifidobacterium callitrichos]
MLTVDNVSKKLSGKTILHGINLEFDHGVYGLLAPNGAGKTTLMKLLTTLLFPDSGSIRLNGEDIVALGERYRGQVGYLPQDFGYYPGYTPRRFLRYIAALQGMPRHGSDERIDAMLAMVGLSDDADKRMRTFSGGMIQRVGIAQALVHDPRILILDEPTAGLDPRERVRFRNIIHSLAADRIVILSTHIVSDLETIAGHIVMLRDGTVYADASPADLCASLAGRIYEVPAGTPLADDQRLLSEVQYGVVTRLRIYSERPVAGAADTASPTAAGPAAGPAVGPIMVAPNLEDAFLVIYGG